MKKNTYITLLYIKKINILKYKWKQKNIKIYLIII